MVFVGYFIEPEVGSCVAASGGVAVGVRPRSGASPRRGAAMAPRNEKGPHEAALRFVCEAVRAYFRPAALRSSAALSVFSHENAVKVSPLASLTWYGERPKWP